MLSSPTALFAAAVLSCLLSSRADYASDRAALVKQEAALALGGSITLTATELKAEAVLLAARRTDLAPGHNAPSLPGTHFFAAKPRLEAGALLPLLQGMPKGAVLHVHSDSMVDIPWLVQNATYDDDLFLCGRLGHNEATFRFSGSRPDPSAAGAHAVTCAVSPGWRSLQGLRTASGNATAFDAALVAEMTLTTPEPWYKYPTLDAVWARFEGAFTAASGIVYYQPVHARYLERGFELFRKDGVQHVEVRQVLQGEIGRVYTREGGLLDANYTVQKIAEVGQRMVASYPDTFTGVRVIVSAVRKLPDVNISATLQIATQMVENRPDVVAGFDLVGQEDPGRPLIDFAPLLRHASPSVRFYFHAGETILVGGAADENLVDALLLNTSRMGHAFALRHHPVLRDLAKSRRVAIEVCPLSNQVLKLVHDLRDHPIVAFVAEGLPVTISPDDPALWGATGSSYDFAMAFMALGDASGLATLKQIALNSLELSASSQSVQAREIGTWRAAWAAWVARVAAGATADVGAASYAAH